MPGAFKKKKGSKEVTVTEEESKRGMGPEGLWRLDHTEGSQITVRA